MKTTRHIPILGLYTDSRRLGATNDKKLAALQEVAENQFHYLNLYTTGLIKLNGAIFKDPGANTAQYVLWRLAFQYDRFNPGII